MSRSVRVKMRSAGIASLLKSDEVRDHLTPMVERGLDAARSNAPVVSGAYRDSLHIQQDTTDRVAVRIVSSAPYGMQVEANTGNLARSLDAAR